MSNVIPFKRPIKRESCNFLPMRITLDMVKELFTLKYDPKVPVDVVAVDPPGKLDNDLSIMFDELGMSPPVKKDADNAS